MQIIRNIKDNGMVKEPYNSLLHYIQMKYDDKNNIFTINYEFIRDKT